MNFHQSPKKNLTGVTAVAVLHLALLAVFLHGSRLTVFHPKETTVDLVPQAEPPKPKILPPDLPLPPARTPDILIPPLPLPLTPNTEPTVTARPQPDVLPPPSTGLPGGEPAARPQPKPAPAVVAAVVDASACAKPDYPKNALRNGDTGTVTLALLVGTDGRVADSRVEKSSGFRELDRAAQVGLGLCRFKPGTVDGVPQQSWTRMQYVWSLD